MVPTEYQDGTKRVPQGSKGVPTGTYKVPTGTYSTHRAQFVPFMDISSIVVRHVLCKRSRGCKNDMYAVIVTLLVREKGHM